MAENQDVGRRANGGGEDEQRAKRNARQVSNGGPDEVPDGGWMGGQTGCPTGPYGVPDGSHVIGHVIFECHVTRLGWQGVILLSTLLSQR
jgi:hypothetical protein